MTRELVQRGANVVGLVRDRVPRSLVLNSAEWGSVTAVHGAVEDLLPGAPAARLLGRAQAAPDRTLRRRWHGRHPTTAGATGTKTR